MKSSETGSSAMVADLGQFDAIFRRFEQSVERAATKIEASLLRIAGTLDTSFGSLENNLEILEVKIDRAGKKLDSLVAVIIDAEKEMQSRILNFLEGIDDIVSGDRIAGMRKIGSALQPSKDKEEIWEYKNQDPRKNAAAIGDLERQKGSLRSRGGDSETDSLIDELRHEQALRLVALKQKANEIRDAIESDETNAIAGHEPRFLDNIKNAERELKTIIDAIKENEALGIGDELKKIIDQMSLPPVVDPDPQQTGSLGNRSDSRASPRLRQFVSAGVADIGAVVEPLRQLDESLDKSAQGYNVLTEAVARLVDQGGSLTELLDATNGGLDRQAVVLGIIRKQVPELAEAMTGFFGETTAGAEGLDRAVAAMGERFLGAFEGAIVRGESLDDTLKSLGRDLANLALNEFKSKGFDGIFGMFGKLFGGGTILNAKGNVFDRGRSLTGFARGGALTNAIVNRPTLFPMADGAGLMGESGPEAVLPLTRLANGDLGVQSLPGVGVGAGAAAAGPPMQFFIDAHGADRDGMRQMAAAIRDVKAEVRYVNNTLERRAVGAMAYARSRGGNIARAFGGW